MLAHTAREIHVSVLQVDLSRAFACPCTLMCVRVKSVHAEVYVSIYVYICSRVVHMYGRVVHVCMHTNTERSICQSRT